LKKRLDELEPREVWRWFAELSRIPRPSGREEQVSAFLESFASERGLESARDELGNVLVRKPGQGAVSDGDPLALQAHVDMVAEKRSGIVHDFMTDPIKPVIEGDWVKAVDTTLGADNGIGVSCMLALLDSQELQHPPLECLFTVDEERGLSGALQLDPSWISARRLINLDSEDEGRFCVGCAGGVDVNLKIELDGNARTADSLSEISIDGLRGGHSGVEIDKNRANALRITGRILDGLCDLGCGLHSMKGGGKRNAIPRSARLLVHVPQGSEEDCRRTLGEIQRALAYEYEGIEKGISISMSELNVSGRLMSGSSACKVRDILLALPHGVVKMSGVVDGLVETSVNLATAEAGSGELSIDLSIRSSIESAKRQVERSIRCLGNLAGGEVTTSGRYPGWRPRSDSALLRAAVDLYNGTRDQEPVVETIHAGLECGVIGDKLKELDMISVGPDIRDVHVPGERVSISSVQRFWSFLSELVEKLGK
jgi:dipeptidase D